MNLRPKSRAGGSRHPLDIRAALLVGLLPLSMIAARAHAAIAPVRTTLAQARGEAFVTGADEVREIILSDGSSLALGPNSRLIVESFAWNPTTRAGEAILRLERGALRVIGGTLNRTLPIRILSGNAAFNLANGGAFVTAGPDGARASLLFGGTLAVSVGGRSEVIQRPGYEVAVTEDRPSQPYRQAPGRAYADAALVNPRLPARGAAAAVLVAGEQAKEERPDDGALTRSELASYTVPTPTFTNLAVQVAQRGDIALGLPATGTISANGNAATGDSVDDIRLAQGYIIANYGTKTALGHFDGSYAARDLAPTTRRLLPASGFDYSAAGLTKAPTFGKDKTGYVFSSGLQELTGLDEIKTTDNSFRTKITPSAFGLRTLDIPATIDFGGLTYKWDSVNLKYTDDSKTRSIYRDTDTGVERFTIIPTVPPRERYAGQSTFVLTDAQNVTLVPPTGYTNDDLVLPRSVIGSEGRITRTSLTSKVAAVAFNNFTPNFGDPTPTFDQFVTQMQYKTYEAAVGALQDYTDLRILTDLVTGTSSAFDLGSTYSAATLQNGFPPPTSALKSDGRALDNFLFLQLTDPHGQSLVFAAGDVAKARTGGASIDSFGIARGLTEADAAQLTGAPPAALAFRAFLPALSTGSVPLASVVQTGLFVANPPGSAGASTSRLFHADLGLSADGAASTASATFGAISYNATAYKTRQPVYDDADAAKNDPIDAADPRAVVAASGVTIGSTRSAGSAAILYESPLAATASGGGRTWQLGTSSGTRPGYVGYLVLEDVKGAALDALGGISSPLGGGTGSSFGTLRLAAGYSSRADSDLVDGASTGRYLGYVGGVLEQEGTGGTVAARAYLGTLDLLLDPVANVVSASIGYDDGSARTLALGARPAGGGAGRVDEASAYIQPGDYGAAVDSGGAHAALVAGEGVKAGLGSANAAKIRVYQHLQWGFFFGDLAPTGSGADTKRNHAALSTWVAGVPYAGASCATVGGSVDCGIKGSASYAGHAIGNVLRGAGAISTVVGSFTQSWNLDSRTGSMQLDFDGSSYRAPLTVTGSQRLTYAGDSTLAGDRQARIEGELVDVKRQTIGGVTDAAARPGGTIGQFQIRDLGNVYQANGTFGGDIVQ